MTLTVPGIAPVIVETSSDANGIRAALPVLGYGQWYQAAQAANWLGGIGGALAFNGVQATAAAGSSVTQRFYAWPRSQHGTWLWSLAMSAGSSSGTSGTVTFAPGGTVYNFTIKDTQIQRVIYVHNPSSSATGEITVAVACTTGAPSSAVLQSVGVYELKRKFLSSTSAAVGVRETSCSRGKAIYENTGTLDKYSAQAVWEQFRDAKTNAKRQALFHWYDETGITSTATTFTGASNVFAIDPAIQARNMDNGGTATRNVRWNVNAKQTGGATGEVKITMTSGATSTITVTSTAAVWHTPATFAISTDDLDETDHIRGATRDNAIVEIRRTGGTSMSIYGVSIGEYQ